MNLRPRRKTLGKIVKEGTYLGISVVAPIVGGLLYENRLDKKLNKENPKGDYIFGGKLLAGMIGATIATGILSHRESVWNAQNPPSEVPVETYHFDKFLNFVFPILSKPSSEFVVHYPNLDFSVKLGNSTNNWQDVARVQLEQMNLELDRQLKINEIKYKTKIEKLEGDYKKTLVKPNSKKRLIEDYMRNLK